MLRESIHVSARSLVSLSLRCASILSVAGDSQHILQGHRDNVRSIAFSPDSCTLVSCSFDMAVRVKAFQNPLCCVTSLD